MGREAFLQEVWDWKAQSGGTIINQLKRLGASCDWSRERFTMDEGLSRAVIAFLWRLHEKGLLYKDKRLVNWDPKLLTAISDLEVEQKEVKGSYAGSGANSTRKANRSRSMRPRSARSWIASPAVISIISITPSKARVSIRRIPRPYITVATTRPETMLGDTAIAVHPENERLKHLIGKRAILPLVGRPVPIIADDYADPEKGTAL